MYTALIVDDESIIRRGLRHMIPWEALGFDEVLEAAGARQALDLAGSTRLSLAITDICMPGIDGLELTQRFLAMQPQISIIVITGYDRFEYAQKCCQMGVRHLVLKPINETEIIRILSAEVERLRLLESGDIQQMERKRRAALSERMLREKLLRRLAWEGPSPQDEADIRSFLGLDPQRGGYAAALRLEDELGSEWSGHRALLAVSIEAFVGQMLQGLGWCFHDGGNQVLMLLAPDAPAEAIMEEARQLVEAEYGLRARLGLSPRIGHMRDIPGAFARALAAADEPDAPKATAAAQASAASRRVVREALAIIEKRYMEDISVTALAAQLRISPNYFSHVFKKLVGVGCNEHITRTRIQAAKQRLALSSMRCYEIAEAVGYHDTNYFSLAFKKNVGMSPEQYRMASSNGRSAP